MNIKGRYLYIIGYITIILVTLLSFLPILYGLDFVDTFYFGCLYLLTDKTSCLFPLTQGAYLLTNKILGDYIVGYRIVNWLIYFASYFLGFILLCGKEVKSRPLYLFYLAFSLALLPLVNTNVFSGNSLTTLFLTLLFVSIVRIHSGNDKWFIGLCLFPALAALSRFPMIVSIPITLILSLLLFSKKQFPKVLLALTFSVISFLGISMALQGGLHSYISEISEVFSQQDPTSVSSHSTSDLLSAYLQGLKDCIREIKHLALITLIPLVISLHSKKLFHTLGRVTFILISIGYAYSQISRVSNDHYFLLTYLYANIFILTFFNCVLSLYRHDFRKCWLSLGAILISVCGVSGSDSSLILMSGPLFAITPWIFVSTNKCMRHTDNCEKWMLITMAMVLAVFSILYCNSRLQLIGVALLVVALVASCYASKWISNFSKSIKKDVRNSIPSTFAFTLILIGSALSFYSILNTSFNDRPLKELKAQYDEPKFKWIRTNANSIDYFETVMQNYRVDSANNPVRFFGYNSSIFSYYTRTNVIKGVDFSQGPYTRNLASVEHALSQHPTIYLCIDNPATDPWYTFEDYAPLDSIMDCYGYKKVDKESFCIYYPQKLILHSHDSIQ